MDDETPAPASIRIALEERLKAAHLGHADPRAERLLEALVDDAIGLVADGTGVVDLKLVAATLAEMRRALAMFRPWSEGPRKVTAFGSARTLPDDPAYQMAEAFGQRLVELGYMVITGGGPGIMGAVVEGAGAANSFGVGIRLPFEQKPHEILRDNPKYLEFKYFYTRKLFFLKEASAVALFPGGFGTHDEGFETLTLVQTGKARMVPIVFIDVPGGTYWETWDRFVREQLLDRGLISPEDLALYRITHDLEEAVGEITGFYRVFHSTRRIRNSLVMRLVHDVDDNVLDTLSAEFADLFGGKPLRRIAPLKEESDQPELLGLPRLSLAFDHHRFGRLRMFIDRLNELGSAGAAS
ncbi:MAG: TIGR00730 family Rossman fold protein [Candidatus Binatia bacterium]